MVILAVSRSRQAPQASHPFFSFSILSRYYKIMHLKLVLIRCKSAKGVLEGSKINICRDTRVSLEYTIHSLIILSNFALFFNLTLLDHVHIHQISI